MGVSDLGHDFTVVKTVETKEEVMKSRSLHAPQDMQLSLSEFATVKN